MTDLCACGSGAIANVNVGEGFVCRSCAAGMYREYKESHR